ncbi:MAG: Tim44 domain-containing protein [Alphaproteobacteria bacterium]|nr:Tim44 domain-containing protein [Alphaproteobacteria bacterium]
MNEALDPLNLLILAIAVVIFLRLRSVLGRRTGHERKPMDSFGVPRDQDAKSSNDNVVPLPGNEEAAERAKSFDEEPAPPIWEGHAKKGTALASSLEAIHEADDSFHPKSFLEGARMAYEMIVTAFADGDSKTLKNLLTKEVFEGFNNALKERERAGHVQESSFVGIDKAAIIEAVMSDKNANVTIKFVSKLISATRDKEGTLIEGDPKKVREVTDIWTFMRDVSSRDPNWRLVATEAAN